jgi:acyl-CoA synthetase (AMP-forming)/AMP-acid ligase II
VAPLNPNIAARLLERAALYPDRPAIVGPRSRLLFGELEARAASFAAELRRRGVGRGERVLVFVPMSLPLYVVLLGTLHAGAVGVFVDAWADRKRLEAAVRAAAPRAFVGTLKAHLLRLLSPAIRAIPVQVVADSRVGAGGRGTGESPAAVAADWPALITLTTGSTGRPKAAVRSHGVLWAQHEALAAHLGLRDSDVDMPTLPIFVLNNLACGVTSVLPDFDARRPAQIDPPAILAQMRRDGVTTSSGSPAFYERLCGWCEAKGEELPLRALFTGGAPVLPPLARLLASLAVTEAHVVYGSTEAEPIAGIAAQAMVSELAERGTRGGLCAGAPMPQLDLRIARAHDGPVELGPEGWIPWQLAPGEVGEIVVAGPHVIPGYLDDPEGERANKIRDGSRVWHRTGDAGRLDRDGRLWLMGRLKERVVRDGETWWPLPPEIAATEEPGVAHAAYLGIADPAHGERAVLCVETAGMNLSRERRESLLTRVAPWPVDALVALPRIPRDPRHASKTDIEALRSRLAGML